MSDVRLQIEILSKQLEMLRRQMEVEKRQIDVPDLAPAGKYSLYQQFTNTSSSPSINERVDSISMSRKSSQSEDELKEIQDLLECVDLACGEENNLSELLNIVNSAIQPVPISKDLPLKPLEWLDNRVQSRKSQRRGYRIPKVEYESLIEEETILEVLEI